MTFANPMFLWAFLSLIPLAAIYLLKVRPVRKPTTAWFLWEDIFQQNRARSLFQRLRDLFSLLLMMLAFAAIVFALAGPVWNSDDRKDLVLVIDNSASMNATSGMSTRLQEAKKVASQIVQALDGTQRCSIATASSDVTFLSNMTENPRELMDAIQAIEPTSLPLASNVLKPFQTGQDSADVAADSNKKSNPLHRVILISDGCLEPDAVGSIELLKVGQTSSGNAGIIASDLQRLPGGNNRVGVFYQLASTFENRVEAELVLTCNGPENIVKLLPLEINPGIGSAGVFELENAEPGQWTMKLEIDDCLDTDNQAFLTLPPRRPINVSVAAEERFFYENSVLAFSNTGGILQLAADDAQLLIGQGNFAASASVEKSPNLLIFHPQGESPWWNETGEEIEVALPRTLDEDHPAIRHLDATSIPFVGARRLTPPPGAEIWVEAEDATPLIYKVTRAGTSAIVVNLDPADSDFYFSAWFPVLVYSAATHLAGRTETIRSTYPSGQIAPIQGVQNGEITALTSPDSQSTTTNETLTAPLQQTGFYQLENNSGAWQVACSLLSQSETMLDNSAVKDTSKPVNRGSSPAGLLTIVAMLVITAESILYQRRKVG